MSKSTTVIRKGIEAKRFTAQTDKVECELCGYTGINTTFWLWDALDVPTLEDVVLDQLPDTLVLCNTCDTEEMAKVASKTGGGAGSYGDWYKTVVTKCTKSHFDRQEFEGRGHLTPSSERGGLIIDTTADYALFFSSGWERIIAPDVIRASWGKPEVPDLSNDDRSDWPSVAVVYWRDYGAPNADVVRYVQWAEREWASGRGIQFGCYGGHGRTGTFFALLLVESGMYTPDEAIKYVREKYCADAIEGKAQKDFIKKYERGMDPRLVTGD